MLFCACNVLLCYEGIFAPLSRISKFGALSSAAGRGSLQKLNYGKIEVSHVTAKVDTGDSVASTVCSLQDSYWSAKTGKSQLGNLTCHTLCLKKKHVTLFV